MRALLSVHLEEPLDLLHSARPLLDRLGAMVDVLYVPPPPDRDGRGIEARLLAEDEVFREQLRALLARVTPEDRRGQCLVFRHQRPEQAIVERAGGYDLLVLGTHGRTGAARFLAGSVAERVVRTSPIPVLVLHPGSHGDRILVGADLDDPEPVLGQAGAWAERLGMHADAVWVRPLASESRGTEERVTWRGGWRDTERDAARAFGSALTERISHWPERARGVGRTELGEPAETLLDLAATGYGLVVVGTHGRSGLARMRLGSVAERVVRLSDVPVLVIPFPPEPDL